MSVKRRMRRVAAGQESDSEKMGDEKQSSRSAARQSARICTQQPLLPRARGVPLRPARRSDPSPAAAPQSAALPPPPAALGRCSASVLLTPESPQAPGAPARRPHPTSHGPQ